MDKYYVVSTPISDYYAKCFMDIMGTSHLRDRYDFLNFTKTKTSTGRLHDLPQVMKTVDRGAKKTAQFSLVSKSVLPLYQLFPNVLHITEAQ